MKKLLIVSTLALLSMFASAQTRCKGVKANGEQCKITAVNAAGYCRFHDPEANYCAFIKKDGKQCHMVVKQGVTYCRFHEGKVNR